MGKKKYESPNVEILEVCFRSEMLTKFSAEGNVSGYDGDEKDNF